MDAPVERANIIHLTGITMEDYTAIEDVLEQRLRGAVQDAGPTASSAADRMPCDQIPAIFTSVADWPLSTNLKCWACDFTFDGPPRFIPTFVREGCGGREEIGVLGNFCTFNCAAREIDDRFSARAFADKHWRMRDNLCMVYQRFTGQTVSHIEAAPKKTEMREYGGPLSKDEFWSRLRALDAMHGLTDHRRGTILPERMRPPIVGVSVWEVCEATPADTAAATADTTPANTELVVPDSTPASADAADGTADAADGAAVVADGIIVAADGAADAADGAADAADGIIVAADGAAVVADGTTVAADGAAVAADGITDAADGAAVAADGITDAADGAAVAVDGTADAAGAINGADPELDLLIQTLLAS